MDTTRQRIPQTAERISLAFAVVAVLIIAFLAYNSGEAFRRSSDQAATTRQVVSDTNALLSSLKDAEMGQRGFLLTGEDRYLEPYRQALTEVPAILDRLARIEAERHRADQAQRVDRLRSLVKDKLDELEQTIQLRRRQGLDPALAVVRTDRGQTIMDQIRAVCAEIQLGTYDFAGQATQEARTKGNESALIAVLGSAAVLVLLVFATISTERGTRQRQQLIEALQASEERTRESRDWLQMTLASIGDAVITTDGAGKISLLNDVAQTVTGWTNDAAAGKPLEQVFVIRNEETGREVESPVSRVLREDRIVGLANHTKLIARDGRHIPIDDSAAPIRDSGGKIAGVVMVFRDISAQRQAEATLRLLASIVESSDDAIIGKDLSGVIMTWNRGAERIFGYSAAEAVGKPISMLVAPGKPDDMPEILKRIRSGERVEHFETVRKTKHGNLVNISLTVSPVYDAAGQVVGASKIARDITEQVRARAQIAEMAERLRITLSSIGDAVIATDPNGAVAYMNPVAEKLTAWPLSEAAGKPLPEVFRIVNEQTRKTVENPVSKVLREGRIVGLANHTVLIARSGQEYAIDDSAAPIRDAGGEIVGVVMVFRDNTAVRDAEERLRLTVDAAPNAMIMVASHGRIELVNSQTEKLFGYEREELLGQPVEMLVPERYRTGHGALRTSFLNEPSARPMGGGRELFGLRKDGTEVPIEIGLNPISTSDGDFVIAAIIDISERKRAEESIRTANEELRRTNHLMEPVACFVRDLRDRVVYWNPGAADLYGFSNDDAIGHVSHSLLKTEFPAPLDEILAQLRTAGAWDGELLHTRRDGRRIAVASHWALHTDSDGRPIAILEVNLDISDRERAERQLRVSNAALSRANEDLNQFAFAASHDLQEPLRMITAYAQLLVKGYKCQLEDEAGTCVQFITDGTKRMRELLADLLAYTQVANDRRETAHPIDLNRVFQTVVANCKIAIDEATATVTSGPLPTVQGQEPHFIQLLQNLISNGIKYRAPARPPRIHVSAEQRDGQWRFAVKDNGIGIAPEYHNQIFGVFKRLHGKNISGTGIGLAICQRVIDRYGGELWVESKENDGATFYFTLLAADKGAAPHDG